MFIQLAVKTFNEMKKKKLKDNFLEQSLDSEDVLSITTVMPAVFGEIQASLFF